MIELPERAVVPEKPALVRIETEPPGAEVTIDGGSRGAAPVEVSGLKPGAHEVVATLAGRQPASRKLTLRLVNPEAGVKTSVEVEIVANRTTVKKLRF